MAFTAKDVAELRKQTGCGMMDCKKALTETNGDFEAAVKYLREKGMGAVAKKADRIAAEGLVDVMTIGDTTAIVEVNSETDFVAKNATFKEFVKDILKSIIAAKPADVDALLASKFAAGEGTVADALAENTYKIGEKLSIRRFVIVEGVVSTYIHGMGATGVIVSFDTDVADKDGFAECAKNIALQTAAMEVKYLDKESVPADVLAEEEAILIKQMKEDPKMANKPDNILANIVKGRLGKFYENNCLLEQAYVKDDSMSVAKYVASVAKELGGNIKVTGYVRFDKGEGIQKREEDFGAEIAKMMKG
ncbi:MAG: elongation factor Ts [Clostridia bacterium]|nr:elongation factor Ts [Clostridia bacterium]MBO5315741.1 elongation factor Ts [Clostridia bacterium]MBR3805730.1 elongation factor Ts [Clostridia bacterium]